MSDDKVSVEIYFSDKTLEETLDIIQKFLVVSGYSIGSDNKLGFVGKVTPVLTQVPPEFTARG